MTFKISIPRIFFWAVVGLIALATSEDVAFAGRQEGEKTSSGEVVRAKNVPGGQVEGPGKVLVVYHRRFAGSMSSALTYSLRHAKADEAEVLNESPDLSQLGPHDTLYLVSHGRAGYLIDDDSRAIAVDSVMEALVRSPRRLPANFKGVIHLVVCQAGLAAENQPSLVEQFATELGRAGYDGIEVVGPKGSIRTNGVKDSYDVYVSDDALSHWLDLWAYSAAFFTGTLRPKERDEQFEQRAGLEGFGQLAELEAKAVLLQERVALNPNLADAEQQFQEFMAPLYRLIADSLEANLENVVEDPIFIPADSPDRLKRIVSVSPE